MKNSYFTHENIDKKSEMMLQKLTESKIRNIAFNPSNSALIVVDMQNYFIDQNSHAFIPSSIAIIPKIKKLVEAYNQLDLPVIFTRHINTSKDAGMMLSWWKDLITKENPLSEIIPEFNLCNSVVIEKSQYDAFYETQLELILREKGIDQIIITGLVTHLCCETTIRSAYVRGFKTFFPIDTTATYNEEFHQSSFINLTHGFSVPVTAQILINRLEGL